MPSDALTISYITKELNEILSGGKITKINQPEKDEVIIYVYTKNGTKRLVISANANLPRCHITNRDKQNPITAPSFCMLLRKHLLGGTIDTVINPNNDRIVCLNIISKNEMKDEISLKLFIELISKQSNLILTDDKLKIYGALKKNSLDDESSSRVIMTGITYTLPENKKTNYKDIDSITKLLTIINKPYTSKELLDHISGYSYQTASYITNNDTISGENELVERIEALNKLDLYGKYQPCIGYSNGKLCDYFVTEYTNLPLNFRHFPTINEAIEFYYTEKDNSIRIKEHGKRLNDIIKHNISRTEKKLVAQRNQLKDSEDLEQDRLYGELITSNIYLLSGKETEITVDNYYSDPPEKIRIKLDPSLSPAKNAQNYYKKYNKKKRTIEFVSEQIIESESHLNMLKNIQSMLNGVSDISELELINQDLIACGIIPKPKNNKKKTEIKAKPREYQYNGYTIFVGRSSTENEYVTHKLGKGNDIWMHVKKAFGSHVLIKTNNNTEIPDDVYVIAAEIAAFYSEEKNSDKVEVDYTEVKNVKKPQSGKLGLVVYNTNYSIICTPNEHKELKI